MTADELTTADDVRWIDGLRARSSRAVQALHDRVRAGLGAAFGGRADVSDADLDDFVQDAVLRTLERLDSFRGESAFSTWAMAIAVRSSLTSLRRRRWTQPSLEDFAQPLDRRDSSAAGERSELISLLRDAIDAELTARQRQVLTAELDGVPTVVLAEQLSTTPGAIYKITHDARKKLKRALERAGVDARSVAETLGGNG